LITYVVHWFVPEKQAAEELATAKSPDLEAKVRGDGPEEVTLSLELAKQIQPQQQQKRQIKQR
jgi:hypothetical protein